MNYRKYMLVILCTTLLVIGVYPILFFFNLGYQAEGDRHLNEWWEIKEEYAAEAKSPKILLISGSNTLFGIDAALMEKELQMPVVNFGTHAGLNRYVLSRSQKSLKTGDIVILPLEYPMYEDNPMEEGYTTYIMGYDTEFFWKLPWYKKIKFIYKVPSKTLLRYCWQHVKPPVHEDSRYDSKYLNRYGDMTNNSVEHSIPAQELIKKIPNKVFRQKNIPSQEAKSEIVEFLAYCRQNDIHVYAAWPAFLWKEEAFSDEDAEAMENIKRFWDEQGITVLGDYRDSLYDSTMFYDTIYHLNIIGKEKRTTQMLSLIRTYGY